MQKKVEEPAGAPADASAARSNGGDAPSGTEPPARKTTGRLTRVAGWPLWRQPKLLGTVLVALIGPIVAAGIGGYLYLTSGRYAATDNAYVKADKIAISSDIAGRVVAVLVEADQAVKRGQVLFRLDAEPSRLALDKAEAELDQTKARVEALRAEYQEAVSEMKEAQDRGLFYDAQRSRQQQLVNKGVGKAFVFEEADSNADAARARVGIARQKMQRVLAQLGGNAEIATDQHPLVREKLAARDRAGIDLERTVIKAPAAGIVTNFDLQPGEYLNLGQVAFSLVSTEQVWVQANFKETDLTHMKIGQRVSVHVDTYPDGKWTGHVASIGPATGAEFAILPPQNATGNWVKVVQRLPVRLKLDPLPGAPELRAGMSVVVEVDTGYKRPLPGWAAGVLGRARASQ